MGPEFHPPQTAIGVNPPIHNRPPRICERKYVAELVGSCLEITHEYLSKLRINTGSPHGANLFVSKCAVRKPASRSSKKSAGCPILAGE